MDKSQVLICLYFLSENRREEILSDDSLSFSGLFALLHTDDMEKRTVVEKESGLLCDQDVSFRSLGVQNCMRFLVY